MSSAPLRRLAALAALTGIGLVMAGCGRSAYPSSADPPDEPGRNPVVTGNAAPSAGAGSGARPRSTALPLAPLAPLAMPPTTPSPNATPPCRGVQRFGQVNGLAVEPGAGTATVSWVNSGDPAVTAYKVSAVPQRVPAGIQPDPTWQTTAPGPGCGTVTTTIRGLARNAPYVFWLVAVASSRTTGGSRAPMIARSFPIVIR